MKIRESGMPLEEQWDNYFEPKTTFELLGIDKRTVNVADFGSGYGTFTIPVAQIISGKVYAIDIEPSMISLVKKKAKEHNLKNIVTILRDFVSEGSGLSDSSVDFVMLFNIIHLEKPMDLLRESHRILKPGGRVAIIHWNYDPNTPRGPPMNIRPRPEEIRHWAKSVGFVFEVQFDLKLHHYVLVFSK